MKALAACACRSPFHGNFHAVRKAKTGKSISIKVIEWAAWANQLFD